MKSNREGVPKPFGAERERGESQLWESLGRGPSWLRVSFWQPVPAVLTTDVRRVLTSKSKMTKWRHLSTLSDCVCTFSKTPSPPPPPPPPPPEQNQNISKIVNLPTRWRFTPSRQHHSRYRKIKTTTITPSISLSFHPILPPLLASPLFNRLFYFPLFQLYFFFLPWSTRRPIATVCREKLRQEKKKTKKNTKRFFSSTSRRWSRPVLYNQCTWHLPYLSLIRSAVIVRRLRPFFFLFHSLFQFTTGVRKKINNYNKRRRRDELHHLTFFL